MAYYWQHLLDEGRIASPGAIAQLEGLDASHVRRLLRLTLLAPTVIDQMVNSESLSFDRIVRTPWPDDWWRQAGLLRSLADSV
ncbi:hypothetical protein [Orrella sp. 11846]|uniref:hypothetical protein n=1 Tax=Orrella sp. 11846 TaxID=3409913 RepID=UPI003B5AD987